MACISRLYRAVPSHRLGEEVDPDGRLVVLVEVVVHKTRDNAGLPHALVPQEDQLVLRQRGDLRYRGVPTVLPKKTRKKRKGFIAKIRYISGHVSAKISYTLRRSTKHTTGGALPILARLTS